jgi:hypothetical protein
MLRREAELGEVRRDHAAAERALPMRQEEMLRLQEQLGALAQRQQQAVSAVIVEVASDFCESELRPRIAELMKLDGVIRGLANVLWTTGQNGVTTQVDAAIVACRPTETALDLGPGSRLLREFLTDPEAQLEVES